MNASLLHPLLGRLVHQHGFPLLELAQADGFLAAPGAAIVFVSDDPAQQKEVLDLAVILPELVRHADPPPRVAVLAPAAARDAAARFGTRRTPALVFYRGGGYLGAIEGLLDWVDFVRESSRILAGEVRREPTVGIAVAAASGQTTCH